MTIDFANFFARAGRHFHAGDAIVEQARTVLKSKVEDAAIGHGALPLDGEEIRGGIPDAMTSLQAACGLALSGAVAVPVTRLLVKTVKDDTPLPFDDVGSALAEFIRQMKAENATIDRSNVSVSIAYGASNAGDGRVVDRRV